MAYHTVYIIQIENVRTTDMLITQAAASELLSWFLYPDLICGFYSVDTGHFVHNDSWGLSMRLAHHEELSFSPHLQWT
jgi:hypothetical protein